MLKDADFNYFPAVYVVCGRTDMRYRIDSLAALIKKDSKWISLFRTHCFFSAKHPLPKLKDFYRKEKDEKKAIPSTTYPASSP